MSTSTTTTLPMARHARVKVEQAGATTVLARRNTWRDVHPGLLLWMAIWTAGCVMLAFTVARKPGPFMILFALPFWAAEVLVGVLLVAMWFLEEELHVGPRSVRYVRRVIVTTADRTIPREEVRGVSGAFIMTGGDEPTKSLTVGIDNVGARVDFAAGIEEDEQKEVIDYLRRNTWLGDPAVATVADEAESRAGRPSDTRIVEDRGPGWVRFTQRGRWDLRVGVMAFACVFWNGIVSVFMFAPMTGAPAPLDWGMRLFLVPFQLVGLCILGGWLVVLLMPAIRRQLAFAAGGVEARWALAGLTLRRRRVDVSRVAEVDAEPDPKADRQRLQTLAIAREGHVLRLLDGRGRTLLRWRGLTEGEAEWMAGEAVALYESIGGRQS